MKKWYLAIAIALTATLAQAQETTVKSPEQPAKEESKGKKFIETVKSHVKFYGFVRNYFYYNSRENLETSGGLIELIPLDKNENALGEDLNEEGNSRYLATTARVGMDITGPDVWGAKTSGKIEFDFNGYSDVNSLFRIRHAYFRMDWIHHALILGQTWHPLVGCATPDEFSYAAGAPYNPLNRSPQIQYNYKPIEGLSLKAALIWQLQYTSVGPSGIDDYAALAKNSSSINFTKYSIIPEMYAGLGYKKGAWEAGAGVDISYLRPRTKGKYDHDNDASTKDITRKVDDHVWSFSPIIYAGWTQGNWSIKAKSILAQNLSHANMISGYAVTGVDNDGSYEYTPLTHTTSFINIFYGKKYKGGLYAGYSKNLGLLSGELEDFGTNQYLVYYKGKSNSIATDIDQHWRICPSFTYNLKHFNIGVQYELSGIDYGTMKSNGKVSDTHTVYNHRVLGMVKYNF